MWTGKELSWIIEIQNCEFIVSEQEVKLLSLDQ